MKKRYIVKFDHHHSRYGVHDTGAKTIEWLGLKSAAVSAAARLNATEAVVHDLSAALSDLAIIETGSLTTEKRDRFAAIKVTIQEIRNELQRERRAS